MRSRSPRDVRDPPRAAAAEAPEREPEGDGDTDGGKRIHGSCVELSLVDELRPDEDGAEHNSQDGQPELERAVESVQQVEQHRDRDKRGGEVEEQERPAEPRNGPAAGHVVELVPGQPPVGEEDLDGDDPDQRPNRRQFGPALHDAQTTGAAYARLSLPATIATATWVCCDRCRVDVADSLSATRR
jgi:hypothetical protein